MASKGKLSREEQRSSMRRNSCSSTDTLSSNSSKNSITSTRKLSPPFASSTPTSAQSTPKKYLQKRDIANSSESFSPNSDYDFVISGSPAPKISDRTNSLPSAHPRRTLNNSAQVQNSKPDKNRCIKNLSQSPNFDNISKGHSLEEECLPLDLSNILRFENTKPFDILKNKKCTPTKSAYKNKSIDRSEEIRSSPTSRNSTSRIAPQKSKKSSLKTYSGRAQSVDYTNRCARTTRIKDMQRTRSSKDLSPRRSSMSQQLNRDLDYSSVSPEYTSGQSSNDASPRRSLVNDSDTMVPSASYNSIILSDVAGISQLSQRSEFTDATFPRSSSRRLSSTTCSQRSTENYEQQNKEELNKEYCPYFQDSGEWNNFWTKYNNTSTFGPINELRNQFTSTFNKDFSDNEVKELNNIPNPSITQLSEQLSTSQFLKTDVESFKELHEAVQKDGMSLTVDETNQIINCAQTLSNVISSALWRFSSNDGETKKNENINLNNMTLEKDFKMANSEEVKKDIVFKTTQTDISLPNTEYAPRIFENILKELSRSSKNCSFDDDNI